MPVNDSLRVAALKRAARRADAAEPLVPRRRRLRRHAAVTPTALLLYWVVVPVVVVGYALYGDVHAQRPPWPTPPPRIDTPQPRFAVITNVSVPCVCDAPWFACVMVAAAVV